MKEVKVTVKDVLEIVKKNKEKHDKLYNKAMEGYWKKCEDVLTRRLKDILDRKKIESTVYLQSPEDHSKDYKQVIRMLELSVDSEVILDSDSFSRYILNEWHWKPSFITVNKGYVGYSGYSGASGFPGPIGVYRTGSDGDMYNAEEQKELDEF